VFENRVLGMTRITNAPYFIVYQHVCAEVKECVELYIHSPIRLHGVVLSYKNCTGTTLPFTISMSVSLFP
jgi:hypothetical protein